MSGESVQPQAGPSHAGFDFPYPEPIRAAIVPGGVIRRAAPAPKSWIQKVLDQIIGSPRQWVTPSEVVPVTVLAVQRYLLEDEPRDIIPNLPLYCYDVTISDGVYQEKCYLDPSLNFLIYQNILKVGIEMRISRVSCVYNEKRLGQGILCIDNVHCGETLDTVFVEIPFRNRAHGEKPDRPLRGVKSHYLALWNNEDPYGDIWLTNKQPAEYNFSDTKIIALSHLETTWFNRRTFPALLVRILQKSKLRYYGKPDKKMIEPYQTFLEVADSSGTVSVIMWNTLCPEWYKSLHVGLVLLLQDYSVKKSYPFRMPPLPADPQIKVITTMGPISELDDMPENRICDVIGLLVFVGRVQRSKKKESREDYWSYRWIHIIDGTSELPFIVELFSTSQPEIFENIYPMSYFVCTQLKVVRNDTQTPKLLYLTTTNESRVFMTGGHRGQPYTYEAKVKNFIQWIKTKTESGEVKNTVIGGYYPYPPVPETFTKYSSSVKVESLLTAMNEVKKEIEDLQYREQKRIAIQGIITVVKFIPHSSATESATASEIPWINRPSTSHDDEPMSFQSFQNASISLYTSNKVRVLQGPIAKPVIVTPPEAFLQAKGNRLFRPSIFQYRDGTSSVIQLKARRTLNERWESPLWREKRLGLIEHLHYSNVYPESIPRKFILEHKKFLIEQYNSQPAKYIPPEGKPPKLDDFQSARSLGHFEVTILGLNHEIAIDVAFLPMYSPEDLRTSQIDTLLTSMNYSCVYPQEVANNDRLPGPRAVASDIIKAAAELDKVHIIGILDICNLGNNKMEVCLHKIYRPENTY
ncbi:RPA-related protein RADX [Otolemur garnettii]|uniref:RPA-related protein RADX n=1 Tax=Otolemur garnettii TaxID=30611 RepID=UPI000C7F4A1F|nr:RPA-related protein RADX [Otolemur garnettii]